MLERINVVLFSSAVVFTPFDSMAQKQQTNYADIILSCLEEHYLRREISLDHHSLVRIISGEMNVTQAANSYTFVAGDTLLLPRNQLSMVTKKPRDGRYFKSVMMTRLRPTG